MAKWGEGDPRWIVEERPDATNVNNWHWTEKNASDWSKGKVTTLFKNLTFEEPGLGTVTITDVSKCEGESTANNRKGKLILFYEWSVEMEWSAKLQTPTEQEEDIKGKIEITNFSEENEPSEIEITVTLLKGDDDSGQKFKEFIRLKGVQHIRNKVALYIQALKDEYATDLILPTKTHPQAKDKQSQTTISQELAANVKNIRVSAPLEPKTTYAVKFNTTAITLSQDFKCTADEIYKALTVQEMVAAFTRGEAKLIAEKGGKFELFGGNISGEFVELLPQERIVQKWRFKTWPDNHFSEVLLTITQGEDSTKVDLHQSGVPVSDVERTRLGWQNYYWDSIKRTFGFGATLI